MKIKTDVKAQAIETFFSTRNPKVEVKELGENEYKLLLDKGEETSKSILKFIPTTNIVCVYEVVTTSLVDKSGNLITFERIGQCTNYLTYNENRNEVGANDFQHVFSSKVVEL